MSKKKERLSLSDILSMYDSAAQEEEEELEEEQSSTSELVQTEKVLEISIEDSPAKPEKPQPVPEELPTEAIEQTAQSASVERIEPSEESNSPEPETIPESTHIEPEKFSEIDDILKETQSTEESETEEQQHTITKPQPIQSIPEPQSNHSQPRSQIMQANQPNSHPSTLIEGNQNTIISTPQNDYDIRTPEGVTALHQEMIETLSETEDIMSRIHNSWDAKVEIRTIYTELEKAAKLDASSAQIIKLGESIARLGDVVNVESPDQRELSRHVMKLENMRSILTRYIDFLIHCK